MLNGYLLVSARGCCPFALRVGRVYPSARRPPCDPQSRRGSDNKNHSISRRFCLSEAGHVCPQRRLVRVPAYIRGALRTTCPPCFLPLCQPVDRRALPTAGSEVGKWRSIGEK